MKTLEHFLEADAYRTIDLRTKGIIVERTKNYPVNVHSICTAMGLEVTYEFMHYYGDLGTIKKLNDSYEITIDKAQDVEDQRFIIAHLLSHYLLHKSFIDATGIKAESEYRKKYINTKLSLWHDVEANKLAAKIIAPIELIHKAIDNGNPEIAKIADKLQVSETVIRIRLGIPY